ncbi:MAG: hypothetical protein CMB80_13505 [Flammeovirgaceae bacterium]|nr:hypothetical protein [Flammeovirgaceae bacterium]MBE61487.1 hypothetical protein [Flammeovirgaceae bacterium]MBR06206.1 hypothetical protein [Rickettsiales bacterium]HCX20364.1 hypothetical protein [Cytophagales bacterium]
MSKAFKNWKVVLLSLIGATTFWFFNALNKSYDARISYPVEFIFEQDSVVVMKPLASTVAIDVSSGGWNLLRKITVNVTPIQIELENPTEIGFYTRASLLPIVTEQLSELKINYVATDTVFIDIEQRKTKQVALKVDSLKVDLAENHRMVSAVSISPDTIQLIGPKSFIDSIGNTYTLGIPTRGISSDFDRNVEVRTEGGRLTSTRPEDVRVSFKVDKFERQSIEVPVEIQNIPADSSLTLEHKTVQVFYTVRSSQKQDYSLDDFAVTTDMFLMDDADSTVLAILVYHPEEAIEIDVIPEYIHVIPSSQSNEFQ